MTPAAIAVLNGVPFVVSDALLAALPAAGGEREAAQVIAGAIGAALDGGLDIEVGQRSHLEIAGIDVAAAIEFVSIGTAVSGVMTVCLRHEAGPWLLARTVGEVANAPRGLPQ